MDHPANILAAAAVVFIMVRCVDVALKIVVARRRPMQVERLIG
jgi:hypothetical protein